MNILITITVSILTVIFTYFISNFLRERSEYAKLRQKLETIAGKNSKIVYEGSSVGEKLYKISDFGKHGITIKNSMQQIFIPASKVLQMEFVLPVEDYNDRKDAYEKEQLEKVSKAMFDPMLNQLKESLEKDLEAPDGELKSSIKSQVIIILKEEGILIPNSSGKVIEHDES